jgi:hypothetical protein
MTDRLMFTKLIVIDRDVSMVPSQTLVGPETVTLIISR